MASLRAGIFCCLVLAVSVLNLGQSASITKVNNLELPGGERLSKREAPPQVHEDIKEKKDDKPAKPVGTLHTSADEHEKDAKPDAEDASSHPIYRPIGREQVALTRQRRAAAPKTEEAEDMDTAANTVFLPQFRKHFRPANRFRREVNDEGIENFALDLGEGNGRYVREAQNQADDLDTAANTVFLPQFRRRLRPNFRQF